MSKYYYENKLSNQNLTAKPNVAWVADCTSLELGVFPKINIFLCIDVYTNVIVAYSISKKTIESKQIIRKLEEAIEKRFSMKPRRKLIIHTDRGTQFSAKVYNNFVEDYKEFFKPSMSRANTPTDNAVAERFMRTFKEHKIYNVTLEEKIQGYLISNSKFNSFRKVINQYVRSINETPNKKSSKNTSPQNYDMSASAASMLMLEPRHARAFSEHFGEDPRRYDIEQFKSQNQEIIEYMRQIAAKKVEVVSKTPFDDFETNLGLQLNEERFQELLVIIQNNAEITKEYVESAMEPVREDIEELSQELNQGIEEIKNLLTPKPKRKKNILPLRDPVKKDLFPFFFSNAGTTFKYQKDLKQAQLRIAYTILYHVGLRINEIRKLTEKDIRNAIAASQFSIIHYKTEQSHIHILSKRAVKDLKSLEIDFQIVFEKYKYKYLFGKDKPIIAKSLIRTINQDLRRTSNLANIPYNIKSHSFRINVISNLLKHTTVQNAADIIGHSDIRSTLSYKRYTLSKTQIQDLLDKISDYSDDDE